MERRDRVLRRRQKSRCAKRKRATESLHDFQRTLHKVGHRGIHRELLMYHACFGLNYSSRACGRGQRLHAMPNHSRGNPMSTIRLLVSHCACCAARAAAKSVPWLHNCCAVSGSRASAAVRGARNNSTARAPLIAMNTPCRVGESFAVELTANGQTSAAT
jgi:hypothetical protein